GLPQPGNDQNNDGIPPTVDTPVDPANLEYARQATDLALDRLKEEMKKPGGGKDLLDKLKWSREDAERFIRRWEELKRAAKESGPAGDQAREQLDDPLRNLGLRPSGTALGSDPNRNDQGRNLRETARTRPPPEYAEQYRAYSRGTSQARPGAEP